MAIHLPDHDVEFLEEAIRDMAATVLNSVRTRKAHPSYGVTVRVIRAQREQMEGAIGLYMMIRGQAMHPNFPSGVKFNDLTVQDRVFDARCAADSI